MAQLPTSMRRKPRAAITSIHEKPPTRKEKLTNLGGWLMLVIACLMLVIGVYGLYRVMTDATVAELQVVGARSDAEQQQLVKHLDPVIQANYFTEAVYSSHQQLPLLHGPASQSKVMMRRYNEINQLFRPVNLRLKELYLTERMTWFMQFDSGLRIIVDQDQTMSKLQRLSHLAQTDLKPVWNKISAIDLRYRNGLAIQWKSAAPPKIINSQFVVTIDDTSIAGGIRAKP